MRKMKNLWSGHKMGDARSILPDETGSFHRSEATDRQQAKRPPLIQRPESSRLRGSLSRDAGPWCIEFVRSGCLSKGPQAVPRFAPGHAPLCPGHPSFNVLEPTISKLTKRQISAAIPVGNGAFSLGFD
jgi:hypothetical protein